MTEMTRRGLLAGAGAVGLTGLAGCAAYGDTAPKAAAGGDAGNAAGAALAKVADIPVGGGRILADEKIVVTQPVKGEFKCFSAICTHAGCVVGDVSGGTINCPCHGSKFKVADGSVAAGPAKKALEAVAVKVDGDTITKA